MVKRVLFAFPDYSHTCLRSIKLFVNQGFEVDIAIAYHFKWIPFFFKWMPNNSLKKLYKRREIVEELLHTAPPKTCLLYTSPSPRDGLLSRMPSSA